jgi:hypothetical protein
MQLQQLSDGHPIIAAYFVTVLGIGLYLRRYATTSDDFFMAGRDMFSLDRRLNPGYAWMSRQISLTHSMVDDGCDGIHLDIYNSPLTTHGAVAATRRISEATHQYARNKYGRDVLFAGNLWRVVDPFSLWRQSIWM